MSLASYVEMEAVHCGGSVPKMCCCSPGRLRVRWFKLCSNKQELGHLMMGSTAEDSSAELIVLNAFLGHVHFIKTVHSQPSRERKC